jgi:hypothetical protein
MKELQSSPWTALLRITMPRIWSNRDVLCFSLKTTGWSSFLHISICSEIACAHSLRFLPQILEIILLIWIFFDLLSLDADCGGRDPDAYCEDWVEDSASRRLVWARKAMVDWVGKDLLQSHSVPGNEPRLSNR